MNANIENFLLQCTSNSSFPGIGEGLAAMFGGGQGGPGLPKGVDPKQMEQMWKMLDDMAEKDPEEYKKFISSQMAEMKEEVAKEKKEEEKAQMITSEPSFSVRIYTARKVTGPKKDKKQEGVKIFDFHESQIKESFIDNDEKADPIDEPKFYLNVLYHDNVLPPLNKGRDIADPKNDREWLIIPIVFGEPKQRKNLEGKLIITYDCHVNPCVIAKMKGEPRAMRSISNFIVLKFQEQIEDSYILHKKSIKFLKKKYKCPKGSAAQIVQPFLLPKEHDARSFKQVREKIRQDYEQKQKQGTSIGVKKEDIKLTPTAAPQKKDEPEALLESIKIPGQAQASVTKEQQKKVVIQEMGKTIPNYEIKDEGETVTMTLNVEEENSAKEIDLDFSQTTLLLNSKNYELTYNFQKKNGFEVDPNSVKAKFNKKNKTLALTFTKVV